MLQLRKSQDRGRADHGWLKAKHTFSFADYHDPEHMGFSVLRVMNEDRIQAGKGFGTHGHQNMEIITVVIEGALEHKDSMGNSTIIKPGEVQKMSAGTGVRHSEYNHLQNETTHLYQIWILPDRAGYEPSYGQKNFSTETEKDNLTLAVSAIGQGGPIEIHQDIKLFLGNFSQDTKIEYPISPNRNLWLQVISGEIIVNNTVCQQGDGLAVSAETKLFLEDKRQTSQFLLFDLP